MNETTPATRRRRFHAPGRINLIGEHIDYLGGTVLPAAIDIGTDVWITPRDDRRLRATSANFPECGTVDADLDAVAPHSQWGWVNYLVAVAYAMQQAGLALPHGYDIEVSGKIPRGAGLSSSASIEVAFGAALNADAQLGLDAKSLALICQAAENNFVGVACGIMDQLSIAAGRQGKALAINCGTLEVTEVAFPPEVAIVAANTNKRRELADSAYNDRRQACESAQASLSSGRLIDLSPDGLGELLPRLDPVAARRVRHVVTEQQRVMECANALRTGNLARVGELMRASHESLRDDFEVTGPELDALAEAAWSAPGVIGARMTGAGFGGCTVNLVEPAAIDAFVSAVGPQYGHATGLQADFYVVGTDDGAHEATDPQT